MKTDQNSNMQGTLNKRISMKKRRNAKRALLALNLVHREQPWYGCADR